MVVAADSRNTLRGEPAELDAGSVLARPATISEKKMPIERRTRRS